MIRYSVTVDPCVLDVAGHCIITFVPECVVVAYPSCSGTNAAVIEIEVDKGPSP